MDPELQRSILRAYHRILQHSSDILLRVDVGRCMRKLRRMGQIFSTHDKKFLLNHLNHQMDMLQNTRLKGMLRSAIRRLKISIEGPSSSNEDTSTEAYVDSASSSSESKTLYKVHRLMGFRLQGPSNSRSYLVRWKGYDSDDDTWEPVDRLMEDGCGDLIAQFHREHMRFR